MTVADLVALVMLLALAAYAAGGGVDYGAGFWDLVAGGAERGDRPRRLVDHAMAPVWEVNNVWLVFVLVLMWTGFPTMFQAVFTVLWAPIVLGAVGLVLRGAGFAFRKPSRRLAHRRRYGAAFAVASVLTPFFFATAVGGIASGRVEVGGSASLSAWVNPTSLTIGFLAVAGGAFLGAVFLTGDAHRLGAADLVGYFRRRALAGLGILAALAAGALVVLHGDAPVLYRGLTGGWPLALAVTAAVTAAVTMPLLLAAPGSWWPRLSAVVTVLCAVGAWGLAQRPYLLPPALTVAEGAGAAESMRWLVVVSVGAVLLVGPALALLYRLDARGELD